MCVLFFFLLHLLKTSHQWREVNAWNVQRKTYETKRERRGYNSGSDSTKKKKKRRTLNGRWICSNCRLTLRFVLPYQQSTATYMCHEEQETESSKIVQIIGKLHWKWRKRNSPSTELSCKAINCGQISFSVHFKTRETTNYNISFRLFLFHFTDCWSSIILLSMTLDKSFLK